MAHTDLIIEAFDRARDSMAVARVDASFTTDRVFALNSDGTWIGLESIPASVRIGKTFTIDPSDASWEDGFVAMSGGNLIGVVALEFAAWNRRLIIRHCYVDLPHRNQGVARALIDRALDAGKECGAATVWIETSNVNVPAIEAYRRMGFEICGFDRSYYSGTEADGEFAVFLSRDLRND